MKKSNLIHNRVLRLAILAISFFSFVTTVVCGPDSKESGAGVYIFQRDGSRYVLILYSDGGLGSYVARWNGQRFDKHMGCESNCGHFWKRDGKTITLLNGTAENAEYYVDGGDLIEVRVTAPLEAKEFALRGPGRRYSRVAKFKVALP